MENQNVNEPIQNEPIQNEPTPTPLELPDYLQGFIKYFSEFKPLAQTEQGIETIENQALLVSSLYPRFLGALNDNAPLTIRAPFYMLLAHYLVISGGAVSIGINAPSGLTQSASIDGVSVSMLAPPNKTQLAYFFNQTKYGLAYLAWLDTQSGVMLVNN